jgi:hypothetical protein
MKETDLSVPVRRGNYYYYNGLPVSSIRFSAAVLLLPMVRMM